MENKNFVKTSAITAYFDDLLNRVTFLEKLYEMGHRDEALMLCCCYIEALGSRHSKGSSETKKKNYCDILAEHGDNEIWQLVHPKQLKNVISKNRDFNSLLDVLRPLIEDVGSRLLSPQEVLTLLSSSLNKNQQEWLQNNIFKCSMASISYECIRSELVHDISAIEVSFSETTYNGKPVHGIGFDPLYMSLRQIVNTLQCQTTSSCKWWWE